MSKKNIVFDATMLSSLMSCSRKFDFQQNRQFHSINGKSNSLEVGSLVHVCLETFYKEKIKGFPVSNCQASAFAMGEEYVRGCVGCVNKVCTIPSHRDDPWLGLKNTPMESDQRFVGWKHALETVDQYFTFYKSDFWVPLEVEVVKAKILYEDEEIRVMWKAKIDVMFDTNQGIYSTDHKTSKQRRDTLSLSNQFMGQCVLLGTRAVVVNKIGFQKTLKPEEKFTRVMMSYSIDRLLEWQEEVLPHYAYQLLNYAESEHFPPNFTSCESKYGNCIFVDVCSSDRGMREEAIRMNFIVGPKWNPTNDSD